MASYDRERCGISNLTRGRGARIAGLGCMAQRIRDGLARGRGARCRGGHRADRGRPFSARTESDSMRSGLGGGHRAQRASGSEGPRAARRFSGSAGPAVGKRPPGEGGPGGLPPEGALGSASTGCRARDGCSRRPTAPGARLEEGDSDLRGRGIPGTGRRTSPESARLERPRFELPLSEEVRQQPGVSPNERSEPMGKPRGPVSSGEHHDYSPNGEERRRRAHLASGWVRRVDWVKRQPRWFSGAPKVDMDPRWEVLITGPDHRERLVVEVYLDRVQVLELSHDEAEPMIDLCPRSDGTPWTLDLMSFREALEVATTSLLELDRSR